MDDQILVLLVEDEAILHLMVEEALKDGGFAVKVTAKGQEAIQMLEAPDANYRALIPT